MKVYAKAGSMSSLAWLGSFGALLLLFMVGCATSQSAEDRDARDDDEQVDVGYGKADKNSVVGSVSTIDGEKAQDRNPRTLADMLRGHPGVQVTELPGGGVSVRIRGAASFMGSTEPLYVVDDMVIQPSAGGGLYGINPQDVESITVLKDAGATAVYGSRGANGVILIKTKRGK